MKLTFFFITTILSLSSFAGSYFKYKSLGFSSDHKYYAFTQFGHHDGAGHADAWTWVVNVKDNKLVKVGKCDCFENNQEKTIKEAIQESKSDAKLTNYGFKEDQIIGSTMLKRLPTDLNTNNELNFRVLKHDDYPNFGQTFKLKISETSLTQDCYDIATPGLLKLELSKNEKVKILQNDKTLPNSRKCAYGYTVREIVYEKESDSLAIIISYRSPGFEGPDTNYLVVTTKLDKLPY